MDWWPWGKVHLKNKGYNKTGRRHLVWNGNIRTCLYAFTHTHTYLLYLRHTHTRVDTDIHVHTRTCTHNTHTHQLLCGSTVATSWSAIPENLKETDRSPSSSLNAECLGLRDPTWGDTWQLRFNSATLVWKHTSLDIWLTLMWTNQTRRFTGRQLNIGYNTHTLKQIQQSIILLLHYVHL